MMKKLAELLTRHRNLFLLTLLTATLAVSALSQQERLQSAALTVDIPVMATSAVTLSPLESYRQQRDQSAQTDIAALEKLIAQTTLDEQTRRDAADKLSAMIEACRAQSAMEGALMNSSLSPCVAVVAGNAVTIVTGKSTVTEKDTALVLTLAAAHTGVKPQNVRIITAE